LFIVPFSLLVVEQSSYGRLLLNSLIRSTKSSSSLQERD